MEITSTMNPQINSAWMQAAPQQAAPQQAAPQQAAPQQAAPQQAAPQQAAPQQAAPQQAAPQAPQVPSAFEQLQSQNAQLIEQNESLMKTIDNLIKSTSAETLSADAGQAGEQPNTSAATLPIMPPSFVPQAAQDYTYLRDLDFLPENAKKE